MAADPGLCALSATDAVRLIRARELSPVELMQAVLDRAERLNPTLNAFITLDPKNALAQARAMEDRLMHEGARGALFGLPVSVKDNIFTKGLRTTNGSAVYEHFVPDEDDRAVRRIRAAGAIVFGKTGLPEFGSGCHAANSTFGPARNPWNSERSAGGSSGGAAAAVAAGLGRLSLGTDAGGSARVPASFCGVFGLKPTRERVPGGPGFRPFRDLGHTCPITVNVADAALFLDALTEPAPNAPGFLEGLTPKVSGLHIGYSPDLGCAPVRPEIDAACRTAVARLAGQGATVARLDIDMSGCGAVFRTIARYEWHKKFSWLLAEHEEVMDPGFVAIVRKGGEISDAAYEKAGERRKVFAERLRAALARFDLLACPTVSVTAFEAGERGPKEMRGADGSPLPGWEDGWTVHSLPFSLLSLPAASVPVGFDTAPGQGGLPMGLQLIGHPLAEQTVLNGCAALEAAAGWKLPDLP